MDARSVPSLGRHYRPRARAVGGSRLAGPPDRRTVAGRGTQLPRPSCEAGMSIRPDPGLFRWFWANRVTKPCPECGHPTSVGFDRADPGAAAREPTRFVLCTAAQIDNAVQFSRGELGYPLTEQGPCVSCGGPTRRYG